MLRFPFIIQCSNPTGIESFSPAVGTIPRVPALGALIEFSKPERFESRFILAFGPVCSANKIESRLDRHLHEPRAIAKNQNFARLGKSMLLAL
jgi:hypothetical protein